MQKAVDSAQSRRVVVTRHGKPAAVLVGVGGRDWETVVLEASPRFWKMIERRRTEPTLWIEEVEGELGG